MMKVLLLFLAAAALASCQSTRPPTSANAGDAPVTLTLSKVGGGFLRKSDEFELVAHNRSSKAVNVSSEDLLMSDGVSLQGRWGEIPGLPPPPPEQSKLRYLLLQPDETVRHSFFIGDLVADFVLRCQNYITLKADMRYWPDPAQAPLWVRSNSLHVEE
ncbi:MAG: hypothetical protein ACYC67_16850 [Prosthecobacter sp.]